MFGIINHKFTQKFYYFITVSMWILYIIALTGVISFNPNYLSTLDTVAKLYVAVFLMMRFNPFVKTTEMSSFDKEIAWSAGVFLFLSSTITAAVKSYFNNKITFDN